MTAASATRPIVSAPSASADQSLARRVAEWCFLGCVATLPIFQPFHISFRGRQIFFYELFFAVATAALMTAILRRHLTIRLNSFHAALGLYAASLVISTAFSGDRHRSVLALPRELLLPTMAAMASLLLTSTTLARRSLRAWFAGTAITVAAGLVGIAWFYAGTKDPGSNVLVGGFGSLPPGNYPRVTALFWNFNFCCHYLTFSFLFAMAAYWLGWLNRRSLLVFATGIAIVAAFTVSPQLGGFLLAPALLLWWRDRQSEPARALHALFIGAAVALAFYAATLVSPTVSGDAGWRIPVLHRLVQPSSRVLCWRGSLTTFRDHWMFGRGLGLPATSVEYLDAAGSLEHLSDAHNLYLSIAAQRGAAGLLALASLILVLLRGSRRALASAIAPGDRLLIAALAISLLVGGLYDSLAGSFERAPHLWIVVGVLAGRISAATSSALARSEN